MKELIIPDSGDGNAAQSIFIAIINLEGIDNPRLRGRKPQLINLSIDLLNEGIDNPRLRGRKQTRTLSKVFLVQKELIIPDSGDGNLFLLRIIYCLMEGIDNPRLRGRKRFLTSSSGIFAREGIDNPRLRGRKLTLVSMKSTAFSKELIIPDSGDGNTISVFFRTLQS